MILHLCHVHSEVVKSPFRWHYLLTSDRILCYKGGAFPNENRPLFLDRVPQ